MRDDMGDRMKMYEAMETGRSFLPGLPVYCRIDGRGFSKFTKGMNRPYDEAMSKAMMEVTKYLVEETGAVTGYTQSDEISLCWYEPDYKSQMFFNGKVQKLVSTTAALATAKFVEIALREWPEKCSRRLPTFDSRVIQLPSVTELSNMFLWRYRDAVKNSIQMAAQEVFSHKELQGKNQSEQLSMLEEELIIWGDYPPFFKEGVFVKRSGYMKNGAERTEVGPVCMATPFNKVIDKDAFIIRKKI